MTISFPHVVSKKPLLVRYYVFTEKDGELTNPEVMNDDGEVIDKNPLYIPNDVRKQMKAHKAKQR